MLLDKNDYIDLVEQAKEPVSQGNLMAYILDRTDEKTSILNQIASILHLQPFEVMPVELLSNKTKKNPAACIFPPVTKWLRGFMDAEYVVTDSFHGSVFAIIFNKPFIAIGNKGRGLARFTSLFRFFSLEDRLILSEADITQEKIKSPIDFDKVNNLRKIGITNALAFLKQI